MMYLREVWRTTCEYDFNRQFSVFAKERSGNTSNNEKHFSLKAQTNITPSKC